MRKGLYILLLLLPRLLSSQNADSLWGIWTDTGREDTIRVKALDEWNRTTFFTKPDSALIMAGVQLDFSQQRGLLKWEGNALVLLGTYYLQRDVSRSQSYYQQSLAIFEQLNDSAGKAKNYFNLGLTYQEQNKIPQALEQYQKALMTYEELDHTGGMARCFLSLGNIYLETQDSLALDYYQKSLTYFQRDKYAIGIAGAHGNIGIIHRNRGEFAQALYHTNRSLAINDSLGSRGILTSTYMQLGNIYADQRDYAQALDNFQQSLDISEAIGAKRQIAAVSYLIGDAALLSGDFQRARQSCERGLQLAIELGILKVEMECNECLANAYRQLEEEEMALDYMWDYVRLKERTDSLFNKERVDRMEIGYEYEKQQLADSILIERLEAEQIESELALVRQRQIRNAVIGGAAATVLLFLGLYLFYRNRQQKKEITIKQDYIARLQHVDKMKDQFLANTSHELRTPLNGIIGLAESLSDGIAGQLPAKAVQNLDMIKASGRRLANLVNDILDFSKAQSEGLLLQKGPVDLHTVTDLVLALSLPLLKDKELELINDIPEDLPLADADADRLQQILHNLIGNGIKFTHSGEVRIAAALRSDQLAVTVSDTGIGIPADQFEAIFKSFEQGDGSTAREYGGTGLGLSVTRQLVELHGGEITVVSEVGKGSAFTFTLPVSDLDREDFVPDIAPRPWEDTLKTVEFEPGDGERATVAASVGKDSSWANILVVDDEPVNRQVLENHLSMGGYNVVQASDGPEALKLVAENPRFNLILLDIMMPRMSGYEVCRKLRQKHTPSELPIVMLTAKNRISDLVDGFKAGANDYVTKPFSRDELMSRVNTHLQLQRISKATGKFIPRKFLNSIGKPSITEVQLGDQAYREVTVFFSDIRSYTTLAEQMTPEDNFRFVNSYLKRMGPIITRNEGFVNQYYGDGIMAIFPKQSDYALKAAVEMQHAINDYNQERILKGRSAIRVGMGFHTGPLIMGVIGDEDRNEVATISDTVNTAARFEGLTKHFGGSILLSSDSFEQMENTQAYYTRYLGKVLVKGKKSPLGVYECFAGDAKKQISLKLATLTKFKDGLSLYFERKFPEAESVFAEVLESNPHDKAAELFRSKAEEYRLNGVPDEWTGVEMMVSK